MNLEAYWLLTPLVLIGASGFGWLALWITRRRESRAQQHTGPSGRHP